MLTTPLILRALAGLETGILGAILVLAWFAADAMFQGQHWYAFPNLWSTTFFGADAFHMRLGWATAAGIAFHLAQLGVAGSLFGMIWLRRRSRLIDILAGVTWSFLWYFVMMRGFWKVFAPFVPRLMPQAATMFGVLLFGAALAGESMPQTPRKQQF